MLIFSWHFCGAIKGNGKLHFRGMPPACALYFNAKLHIFFELNKLSIKIFRHKLFFYPVHK